MDNGSKRCHPDPEALLKFLARPDQMLAYIAETAQWLEKKYPGSVDLLPKIRVIYRTQRSALLRR